MSTCSNCGHPLGEGRFCTHCGAPIPAESPAEAPADPAASGTSDEGDWRTDTAERGTPPITTSPTRPVDPRTPPSAVAPPPAPRYPLYADEVAGWTPYGPIVADRQSPPTPAEPVEALEPALEPAPEQPEPVYEESGPISAGTWQVEGAHEAPAAEWDETPEGEPADDHERRRSPLAWLLAAAVVLAVVGTGWWYLARDTDSGDDQTARDPSGAPSAAADAGTDVAADAEASAPRTARPNQDVGGQKTTYDAANMLDAQPETAWRAPGSAAGMTLTFDLAEATVLDQVGLINGYAKTSTDDQGRTFDWYTGNRRVKAVVWSFDDGTKVRQQLDESRDLQTLDIDPVETSTVKLKLVRVTEPGTGPAGRDFTAVSEVSLVGSPA